MTEKGRNLLVGDQDRRAILDVIGIDRIPSEDFATGGVPDGSCANPVEIGHMTSSSAT